MRAGTANALRKIETASIAQRDHARGARLAGLAAAALLPALFWGAFAEVVAHVARVHLAPLAVIVVSGAIALFLGVVMAPIILRDGDLARRDAEVRAELKAPARRRPSRI